MQFASEYPELSDWYIRVATGVEVASSVPMAALFSLSSCIATDDPENAPSKILGALNNFAETGNAGTINFFDAEQFCISMNADLYEILANSIEVSIRQGADDSLLEPLRKLAKEINSVSIHFLTAWSAFNLGRLEECIDYCDQVAEPFCPIYTLMGQALLDLGQTSEAIDALQIACSISNNDELPHFQLAKAFYAIGSLERCWQKLKDAHKIRSSDYEIIGFMAIAAAEQRPPSDKNAAEALRFAKAPLRDSHFQGTVRMALLTCTAIAGNVGEFSQIQQFTSWDEIPVNKLTMKLLSTALRHLFEMKMDDQASELLQHAEVWTTSSPATQNSR